jgi:hypothetical protein
MRIFIGRRPSFRMIGSCVSLTALLAACGGGNVSLSPQGASQSLAAAMSQTCFTPSTQAQSVALPSTGGITGTLAIAAGLANATSCDVTVKFSTGSSALSTASNVRRLDATMPPKPLLEISLDNAFTNNVEVTGAVLNTPPNLSFPDGQYQASITFGTLPPTVLIFTAANGVLTLASTGTPIVIAPGTSATLALYARGVTPPEPTPSPAAPTPTPNTTASPTSAPTATSSPTTGPTATAAAIIASSVSISPSNCVYFGLDAGKSQVFTASIVTNAPPGTVFAYGWFPNLGGSFSLMVPGTTMDGYTNTSRFTVGMQNIATVTLTGSYAGANSGGVGEALLFQLFLPDATNSNFTPVTFANGAYASTYVHIDAGSITCP